MQMQPDDEKRRVTELRYELQRADAQRRLANAINSNKPMKKVSFSQKLQRHFQVNKVIEILDKKAKA